MYGFTGRIVHINLSTQIIEIEEPCEEFYKKYLGGSALNMYYMLTKMKAGTLALSEENLICFSVGPATALPIAGQSRMTVTSKSPLTDAIGDSQSGGFFPAELKRAGFDAITVQGRAKSPVYIYVCDGKVEIRDAKAMWLSETVEVEEMIRKDTGEENVKIVQTGIAGINGVLFSAVMNDCNRANGRNGLGLIMGNKNLRAIAVRGRKRIIPYDRESFKTLACSGMEQFSNSMISDLAIFGTSSAVGSSQSAGGLPTRNYTSGVFEGWKQISGQAFREKLLHENTEREIERNACYACMVQCKAVAKVVDGDFQTDPRYGGPEYETLAAFGSFCGIDNLEAIAKANELCNRYGMDTVSTGATIAWLMECYEKSLLTKEIEILLEGIVPSFGNAKAMIELITMIAYQRGIGRILSKGSVRASEELGIGSELLTAVKKQEAPAHMPHIKRSFAVIYATNPFGPDHQSSCSDQEYELDYEFYKERMLYMGFSEPQEKYSLTAEKIRFARETQYFYSTLDSMSVCQFVWGPSWQLYGPKEFVELIQSSTGFIDFTWQDVLDVGRRRIIMMRLFNAREGMGKKEDVLPSKFFKPLQGGYTDSLTISREEFENALEEFYIQSQWDLQTGYPTKESLYNAKLECFVPILEKLSAQV
ncbi:MAG: aldehyde ferredoxin oxidoreductase family protein [Desulfovibrionaceae bacterium]